MSASASLDILLRLPGGHNSQDLVSRLWDFFNAGDYPEFIQTSARTTECVEFLDSAYSVLDGERELQQKCLRVLRKICYTRRIAPSSHVLRRELLSYSSGDPFTAGGFADVFRGTYNDKTVAIKSFRFSLNKDWNQLKKDFFKELTVWKRLSHPNIIPLEGIIFEDEELLCISPWAENGNIVEYIRRNPGVDRPGLLIDVGKGLDYLHSNAFVHGDLKGPNILVGSNGQAMITDLGLASITVDSKSYNASPTIRGGTRRYMAPELLFPPSDCSRRPTRASDVFSLSMVTIEVFTGMPPFCDSSEESAIVDISRGKRPRKPDGTGITPLIWEITKLCWRQHSGSRPSVGAVLDCLVNKDLKRMPWKLRYLSLPAFYRTRTMPDDDD